ncbi:hypothetical protein B0A49_06073 [Cryomyces minteri]|uniref:Uncharacterized protein n=1 Tax=Cryomyces minteri TaxID=331657 RepID=A0A4U0X9E1_9PEZI|nr:hypothetical protein B0A49_06073 [Cryomyces minteri]
MEETDEDVRSPLRLGTTQSSEGAAASQAAEAQGPRPMLARDEVPLRPAEHLISHGRTLQDYLNPTDQEVLEEDADVAALGALLLGTRLRAAHKLSQADDRPRARVCAQHDTYSSSLATRSQQKHTKRDDAEDNAGEDARSNLFGTEEADQFLQSLDVPPSLGIVLPATESGQGGNVEDATDSDPGDIRPVERLGRLRKITKHILIAALAFFLSMLVLFSFPHYCPMVMPATLQDACPLPADHTIQCAVRLRMRELDIALEPIEKHWERVYKSLEL